MFILWTIQGDLTKSYFPRMLIFRRHGQKNIFFEVISKQRSFPRYVDIYRDMGQKRFFK